MTENMELTDAKLMQKEEKEKEHKRNKVETKLRYCCLFEDPEKKMRNIEKKRLSTLKKRPPKKVRHCFLHMYFKQ